MADRLREHPLHRPSAAGTDQHRRGGGAGRRAAGRARRPRRRRRSTSPGRCRRRPAGRSASGPGWTAPGCWPGRRTGGCWCRGRSRGDVVELVARRGRPAGSRPSGRCSSGLNQPHGLAFAGSTALRGRERPGGRLRLPRRGGRPSARLVVDGLPDAKSPDLRGAYAHALKSVAVGARRRGLRLGRLDRQHLGGGPRAPTRSGRPSCGCRRAAGRRRSSRRGVRNGTGLAVDPDGAVWTAVNNRDNIAYPYDRDYDGDGAARTRARCCRRTSADHPLEPLARLTAGARPRLAVLQPRPRRRARARRAAPLGYTDRPFVRDQQTNADGAQAGLRRAAAGRAGHGRPLGAARAELRRRPGCRRRTGPGPWSASTARGTGSRRARPRWRSSPGATARWAPSRRCSAGSRPPTASRWGRPVVAVQGPDGAVYVSDDRPAPSTGWPPPATASERRQVRPLVWTSSGVGRGSLDECGDLS